VREAPADRLVGAGEHGGVEAPPHPRPPAGAETPWTSRAASHGISQRDATLLGGHHRHWLETTQSPPVERR